jgi:hypothetical protein
VTHHFQYRRVNDPEVTRNLGKDLRGRSRGHSRARSRPNKMSRVRLAPFVDVGRADRACDEKVTVVTSRGAGTHVFASELLIREESTVGR